MIDFELRDAVRSRFVAFVLLLFTLGAGLGALGFLNSVEASERAAREMIARQSGLAPDQVPMEAIREQAVEGLVSMVGDAELRSTLLATEPLAIFFGYVSQMLVPALVLFLTAGAHAGDIASGSTRFLLFRVERLTWALGKLLAQVLILALGLLVAALATLGSAMYAQGAFSFALLPDLLLAALRPLPVGICYLGWFAGIALLARAPMRARAFCLLVLMGASIGHLVTASDWAQVAAPVVSLGRYLFPAEYRGALWRASPATWAPATFALVFLGALGFSVGALTFQRRDA